MDLELTVERVKCRPTAVRTELGATGSRPGIEGAGAVRIRGDAPSVACYRLSITFASKGRYR